MGFSRVIEEQSLAEIPLAPNHMRWEQTLPPCWVQVWGRPEELAVLPGRNLSLWP